MPELVYLVVVIDRDPSVFYEVRKALEGLPIAILSAKDRAEVLRSCRGRAASALLLEASLDDPGAPFDDLLVGDPALEIVLLSDASRPVPIQAAVARGATDVLMKPLDPAHLRRLVSGFLEQAETRLRTCKLDDELLEAYQFQGIVGRSPNMLQTFSRIRRAAPLFQSALITGPVGSGKKLVARALHELSPHAGGEFVICDSPTLAAMLSDDSRGKESGELRGTRLHRSDPFERAHGGTIFLENISDLPLAAQAKLFRILQTKEFRRSATRVPQRIDVHVITSSYLDLRRLVAEDRFHEDLFRCLSVVEIHLPPLADRKEDLPLLQRYFLQQFSSRYGKSIHGISQRAQLFLSRYPWPGNVQELEMVIGDACRNAQGEILDEPDFPDAIRNCTAGFERGMITLEEVEAQHLEYVLSRVDGNKARAAEILGVSRASIYAMLARMRQGGSKTGVSA
jgi:two-component system, NtrC family, response regulator HydG